MTVNPNSQQVDTLARRLHVARQAENAATEMLKAYDDNDIAAKKLQQEIEEAQKELDARRARDRHRKTLVSALSIAQEGAKQAYEELRTAAEKIKLDEPETEAKDLPGVKSLTRKKTLEILPGRQIEAVEWAFNLMRLGFSDLLTVNMTPVLRLLDTGVFKPTDWLHVETSYTVAVEGDLAKALNLPKETDKKSEPATVVQMVNGEKEIAQWWILDADDVDCLIFDEVEQRTKLGQRLSGPFSTETKARQALAILSAEAATPEPKPVVSASKMLKLPKPEIPPVPKPEPVAEPAEPDTTKRWYVVGYTDVQSLTLAEAADIKSFGNIDGPFETEAEAQQKAVPF